MKESLHSEDTGRGADHAASDDDLSTLLREEMLRWLDTPEQGFEELFGESRHPLLGKTVSEVAERSGLGALLDVSAPDDQNVLRGASWVSLSAQSDELDDQWEDLHTVSSGSTIGLVFPVIPALALWLLVPESVIHSWLRRAIYHPQHNPSPNVVFHGPSGGGKSFIAEELAHFLASAGPYPKDSASRVSTMVFREGTSYEHVMVGLGPSTTSRSGLAAVKGVVLEASLACEREKESTHVVVMEEANRGKLEACLGNAMLQLEKRVDLREGCRNGNGARCKLEYALVADESQHSGRGAKRRRDRGFHAGNSVDSEGEDAGSSRKRRRIASTDEEGHQCVASAAPLERFEPGRVLLRDGRSFGMPHNLTFLLTMNDLDAGAHGMSRALKERFLFFKVPPPESDTRLGAGSDSPVLWSPSVTLHRWLVRGGVEKVQADAAREAFLELNDSLKSDEAIRLATDIPAGRFLSGMSHRSGRVDTDTFLQHCDDILSNRLEKIIYDLPVQADVRGRAGLRQGALSLHEARRARAERVRKHLEDARGAFHRALEGGVRPRAMWYLEPEYIPSLPPLRGHSAHRGGERSAHGAVMRNGTEARGSGARLPQVFMAVWNEETWRQWRHSPLRDKAIPVAERVTQRYPSLADGALVGLYETGKGLRGLAVVRGSVRQSSSGYSECVYSDENFRDYTSELPVEVIIFREAKQPKDLEQEFRLAKAPSMQFLGATRKSGGLVRVGESNPMENCIREIFSQETGREQPVASGPCE